MQCGGVGVCCGGAEDKLTVIWERVMRCGGVRGVGMSVGSCSVEA